MGAFGKITRVRASVCHDGSLNRIFDGDIHWMADPKIAGCGGFGDLGTHGLDLLMWLAGDVEQVAADIKVVTGRYGSCDESGEALIRFKNDVTGTLAAGWVDVANPNSLEISGTEAHASVVQGQLYFKCSKVAGRMERNHGARCLVHRRNRWTCSFRPLAASPKSPWSRPERRPSA